MKKILILGAGEMQIPIIQKVNELGYVSIALDYDEKAVGFGYAQKKYVVSSSDEKGVLEVASIEKVDAILTTSDYPVNVVAKVCKILNLPAMTPEVANICTNKYLQRKIFNDNGINAPKFYLVSNDKDLESFNDFPYIVKPVDSSASRGVKRVADIEEMREAIKNAMAYSRSGQVLVEQFIGGKEFSVETLTQKDETTIVSITEKLVIGEDDGYFVEDTHIEPARISAREKALIEEQVKKALICIKANNCPSHTEVKLWDGKAYIIEMACRLGGDYITSDLVPLSTGIDMLANLINLALGKPIDVERKISKISMVQFFNHDNYEHCKKFIKENKERIIRFEVRTKHDRPIRSSLDRMGYIIMQFDTPQECADVLGKIKH